MKNILNNISENEKNEILGHYTGQLKIDNSKFNKLVESSLGNVKPLICEQEDPALPYGMELDEYDMVTNKNTVFPFSKDFDSAYFDKTEEGDYDLYFYNGDTPDLFLYISYVFKLEEFNDELYSFIEDTFTKLKSGFENSGFNIRLVPEVDLRFLNLKNVDFYVTGVEFKHTKTNPFTYIILYPMDTFETNISTIAPEGGNRVKIYYHDGSEEKVMDYEIKNGYLVIDGEQLGEIPTTSDETSNDQQSDEQPVQPVQPQTKKPNKYSKYKSDVPNYNP